MRFAFTAYPFTFLPECFTRHFVAISFDVSIARDGTESSPTSCAIVFSL